jgi:hypothetical protein
MAYTTINKPTDYFNTKLYTGNGSAGNAITGVGFQPDWVWFKCRSEAQSHFLFDAIRGSNKTIQSHSVNAEATSTSLLASFDSDGFTVNTDDGVNGSSKTYASWNWKANGAGSSNTDGSITSTVSANTTSGFSIVSYTGTGANATIGHGLGVAPAMIIIKARTFVEDWIVYHQSTGNTVKLDLNTTNATNASVTYWNNTSPTSSVFSVGTNDRPNKSGNDFIAYCFAEKKGFSKFGSYTGNGSTDGTFVYTGFKPAMVIIKKTSGADDWALFDNKRDIDNVTEHLIRPNTSAAEEVHANFQMDLLSNGFKLRTTDGKMNSSNNYIYMAFAEAPLVGTNNIPTTAR